jgi:hypothetical protein
VVGVQFVQGNIVVEVFQSDNSRAISLQQFTHTEIEKASQKSKIRRTRERQKQSLGAPDPARGIEQDD